MEKEKRNAKGKIHVTGMRALEYTIWRPGESEGEPPEPLDKFRSDLVDAGAVAWVWPIGEASQPREVAVDTKQAIAGLLECDTDFRRWLEARDVKWVLAGMREEEEWSPQMQRGMRGLSRRSEPLQRRFDKRLREWVNKYGQLDYREPDLVDSTMIAAHALRAWALRDLSLPERVWAGGTFPLKVDNYAKDVNKAARECDRDPETGEWTAPTLWSAMCHSIQHAREYGWTFVECAAPGCESVFLEKRHKHVT
jgi:hypothetical protein